MTEAIQGWIRGLEDYPGWKEWNKRKFRHTLFFDSIGSSQTEEDEREFTFSEEVEKQRLVIMGYLELNINIDSLKECEYYFRRYPFRDLPVTRSNHITNICEMYFSRCYQFKQRLKEYFRAVVDVAPTHAVSVVKDAATDLFKTFDKEFKKELKARNRTHHHERFSEIEIARIALKEMLAETPENLIEQEEQLHEYRKAIKYWVQQVRASGVRMDTYLEHVAALTLGCCEFLSDVGKT